MTTLDRDATPASAAGTFGSVITAMVTPFDHRGELDQSGVSTLARWLTRPGWNDGIVVNGTTGESLTTSDEEKLSVVQSVKEAVGGSGTKVIAGVGAGDTRHSIAMAVAAASQGADALLVVAPYYSRPSQRGILEHFLAIADSTPLPVMLYDIPKRTGVAIEPDTFAAAAEHPRIQAVKDAKGDLEGSSWVMKRTDLAYYSGDDALNLPLLSIGAVGFVSVVGHVVGHRLRDLLDCHGKGHVAEALMIHRELLPVYRSVFRAPAAASVKAALAVQNLPGGSVRLPLVDLTEEEATILLQDLESSGFLSSQPVAAV
ncbi:4-hydroxy-tetrahydrodipicolinate synthase [Arthrobacter sp. B0490]|uniref:4-hydroxy-tetrahydrodipicolinate synthase n=1 Tax=Arthrobacter sp. B0490 TaxID=2058891 RepID=UPI000CE43605|nr:4-hydroxy-tetrahydrodipicolinate synthase [Arthrobacter sp. B0490]